MVKNLPVDAGEASGLGSIPGLGRSPGGGNPLQYSCLGNPMDRGDWWATVHGVARVGLVLATKQQETTVGIRMPPQTCSCPNPQNLCNTLHGKGS